MSDRTRTVSPPNPIHSHPEGPPDDIPLREYVEGRLSRLAADSSDRTLVLRDLYDRELGAFGRLIDQRFADQKEAVEKALTANKEMTDQRFESIRTDVEKALIAQKDAVAAALTAVDRESRTHAEAHAREHQSQAVAIDKAEKRNDERFEEGNNFRSQIEQERATYARIDMLNVIERNARTVVEKLDADVRLRMEKMEGDARSRLEKVEGDLRQRLEMETKAREDAIKPLVAWMQRSGGQIAVWIAIAGVAITIFIASAVFVANYVTRH